MFNQAHYIRVSSESSNFIDVSLLSNIPYFFVSIDSTASRLSAVAVQKPAPHFEGVAVVNKDFKNIKLSDYKGKYLVLFFYPLDLCVNFSIFSQKDK